MTANSARSVAYVQGLSPVVPESPWAARSRSSIFPVAVEIRLRAAVPVGEQAWRWHLVARVHGVRKAGEAPYDPKAVRPLGGLHTTRLGCPLQREFGGDEGGLGLRGERDEALQ